MKTRKVKVKGTKPFTRTIYIDDKGREHFNLKNAEEANKNYIERDLLAKSYTYKSIEIGDSYCSTIYKYSITDNPDLVKKRLSCFSNYKKPFPIGVYYVVHHIDTFSDYWGEDYIDIVYTKEEFLKLINEIL